jgi:cytochrome c556
MRDLDRMRDRRLPQALDPRDEEARRLAELAQVARGMAESAARIGESAPAALDATERAGFVALASHLESLCGDLADTVERLDARARVARWREIDATCDACHDRFRIPGRAFDGD